MKKWIALTLCALFVLSLAACGQQNSSSVGGSDPTGSSEEMAAGGWTNNGSPVVTEEIKAKLEKALEELTGASYIPVAYLGSQVVNGTNYALLCRTAAITPDAAETYTIVTLYESTDGSIELADVNDSGRETDLSETAGGWFAAESPEVDNDAKAALEKAVEGLDGASYSPVALLSSQVVSGTNYCLLCEVTPVVPDAGSSYALVYVYADLQGNAKITETVDFE